MKQVYMTIRGYDEKMGVLFEHVDVPVADLFSASALIPSYCQVGRDQTTELRRVEVVIRNDES